MKRGCAFKIASGLGVALDAARMAVRGDGELRNAGLGGATSRQALGNLQRLAERAYVSGRPWPS